MQAYPLSILVVSLVASRALYPNVEGRALGRRRVGLLHLTAAHFSQGRVTQPLTFSERMCMLAGAAGRYSAYHGRPDCAEFGESALGGDHVGSLMIYRGLQTLGILPVFTQCDTHLYPL